MLIEEARWIGARLAEHPPEQVYPLCNIGSSTADFRTRQQPWIEQHLFGPARARGHEVIHVDRKRAEGVDHCGDLLDADFRRSLRTLRPQSVLCSNLLEHVEDRGPVIEAMTDLLPRGGRLIVTVPYKYPIHHDPIDTGFRPGVQELAAEFPGLRLAQGETIVDSTYWRYAARSASYLADAVLRTLAPFYKPRRSWLPQVTHWAWMIRGRRLQATGIVLEKA